MGLTLHASDPVARRFKLLRVYCDASAVAAVAMGCLVLYAGTFHSTFLTSLFPGLVKMRPITAFGFVFGGASLWLQLPGERRGQGGYTARVFSLVIMSIGVITLSEYLFGLRLRISWLFGYISGPGAGPLSARMAPTTATAFLAIGLALLLLDWRTRRGRRPAEVLSLWAMLMSMIAISGYIYNASALYRIAFYTQVALHTSVTLFLLSVAVFFARPRTGIAGDITGEGSGSAMARRFLPVVFFIPILMGWIRVKRDLAGLYGNELGIALYATANVVVLSILVWLNARKMNLDHHHRAVAETETRNLNAELEQRVAERTQTLQRQTQVLSQQAALLDLAHDAIVVRDMDRRILFWNHGAEVMYGWTAEEAVGQLAYDMLRSELPQPIEEIEVHLLRHDHWEGEIFHHTRDGTRLHVSSSWDLQRDEDGAPARILIINNDITERRRTENALRESNQKFQQIVETTSDSFWIRSADMRELHYLSPAFERIWGRSVASLYTNPHAWSDFIVPEDRKRVLEAFAALAKQTGGLDIEYRIARPDGEIRWVRVRGFQVRDASEQVVRLSGIVTDITDSKTSQARLRLLTDRLSLATSIAKVGVWELDLATYMLTWDATMFEIYDLELMLPMPNSKWAAAVHPDDLPAIEAATRKVIAEKGQGTSEFRIVIAGGAVRHISVVQRAVVDDHDNVVRVIGVNMDISERKKAEEDLRDSEAVLTHSAQHDFLTGLPNRMLLNDRVNQAIILAPRHKKTVAVLFLDLDGFKHINDSLGHAIGDKLLQSIAGRLVNCMRATDTVSRQGGDEFVVLLSEMEHSEDAALTARRMIQVVADTHTVDYHDLHITVSIGVSVFPDDGQDAETLIKNADTAMYQAKENGRQSYQFFKPAMNVRAVERQSIEESLRRALKLEEFSLVFQPKVNVRTGEITGAEALLRWKHPTRGAIEPAKFIPVAEDSGLILPIGRWVLREACAQAQAWIDAGLPLGTIAVNISAMEFRQESFLEGVFAILEETGLDPRSLELELTESVLMKRAESAEMILRALRAKGVHVAIDDFGTGYSSLSYLRKFSIDSLKIDQSFVRQITTAPGETGIVTAVISMGRSLKLRVVAEGVETPEELAFLRRHQCDEAQGYYFSRPVAAGEMAALLRNGMPETVSH